MNMIIIALAFSGAVYFAFTAIRDRRLGKSSLEWPCVQGTIRRSETGISERKTSSDDGCGEDVRISFYADVTYEYFAGGTLQQGKQVRLDGSGGTYDQVQEFLKRYPEGAQAPIYYNPANPAVAVLERGGGRAGFVLNTVVAAGLMVGALGVIWFSYIV